MRFLYTTASLALFAATAQAFSTGSPVCKSDDATLGKIAKAGKMGKQADADTFTDSWSFQLWDDQGKQVDGDSIMTNMDYWVTVNGGDYKGVMVYPMFDGQRIPVAKESDIVSLSPGDEDNFQIAGKCAKTDGVTVTHTSSDDKSGDAKVAKVRVMDENAGKFMMSGVVVTAKSTFGKAVTQQYDLVAGQDNNNTDNGDDGDNGGDNGGDGGNTGNGGDATNGGTGTGGDGTTPADDGVNGASSISFVRSAVALIALAAFMLI